MPSFIFKTPLYYFSFLSILSIVLAFFFLSFFLLFFFVIFFLFWIPFGVLKNNILYAKRNQKWQNNSGFAKSLLEKILNHSLF